MSTHEMEPLLGAYLDGELSHEECLQVEALFEDPAARAYLSDIRRIKSMLSLLRCKRAPTAMIARLHEMLEGDPCPFIEQEIASLLDGELSSADGESLQASVLERPDGQNARDVVTELNDLRDHLGSLPVVPVPSAVRASLDQRLAAVTREESSEISQASDPELVAAMVDGELAPEEAAELRQRLDQSPEDVLEANEVSSLSRLLASLPIQPVPEAVLERLSARLQRRRRPAGTSPTTGSRRWTLVAGFSALAASFVLLLSLPNRRHDSSPPLADGGLLPPTIEDLPRTRIAFPGGGLVVEGGDAESLALEDAVPSVEAEPGGSADGALVDADRSTLGAARLVANGVGEPDGVIRVAPSQSVIDFEPPTRGRGESELIDDVEVAKNLGLPIDELALMQPGQVVELDDQQVTLVCVDVERVFNRLRVVFFQNDVRSSSGPDTLHAETLVVEVTASPDQLSYALADLWAQEREGMLITQVEVEAPDSSMTRMRAVPRVEKLVVAPPVVEPGRRQAERRLAAKARSLKLPSTEKSTVVHARPASPEMLPGAGWAAKPNELLRPNRDQSPLIRFTIVITPEQGGRSLQPPTSRRG
ncbi:hypothetical protein Pan216_28970 [Planctomycetes bacterium Pan216]|uniref:Putative zinc-finger domain-containing protein n=1 Tax=Kolteria novifilia TaxID=2527975 RepID=A0A518B4X8_9BACT|nr:hypothetical protein Pan216_28970 [Planctomycetes bacterium Pan216]